MRIAEVLAHRSPEQETLLSHILNCQTIELYKNPERIITPKQDAGFKKLLAKYQKGWPVAYLTGHKEFMSLDFKVTPDVLIPRPETELLVEQTLRCIDRPSTILDIGTGSGNIAVSLAKHLIQDTRRKIPFRIIATDVSRPALRIARANARKHGVSKYIRFYYDDLFEPVKGMRADIIVSNPPYVAIEEKAKWGPGLKYEPARALWANDNGMYYIERIIRQSPEYLKPGGWLLMEIGIGQAKEAMRMAKQDGRFRDIKVLNDYNLIPRVFSANRC